MAVVFGDQLFEGLPGLPAEAPVFMREDMGLCRLHRHHKQKLVLFLSSMRHFADALTAAGRTVVFQRLDPDDSRPYGQALREEADRLGIGRVVAYEPADGRTVADCLSPSGLRVSQVTNPMFLTSRAEWAAFRAERPRGIMADFYRRQRLRLGLLVDAGRPAGGQWSFDAQNRKGLPKDRTEPAPPWIEPDETTREVCDLVEAVFPDHPGTTEGFGWAVDRAGALALWQEFLDVRLAEFGPYEDALSATQAVLWHSRVTPALNLGLLTPDELVRDVVTAFEAGLAPLASVEGYVRQVVGWREFVRYMADEYHSPMNGLGHTKRLKPCWSDGTTGLPPFDTVAGRLRRTGWCHHIERLMVCGSLFLMVEADPADTYRWFMEMFVDSADWVMAPNVYGMALHADGGRFATKPYFSGSAYILRMGDYPRGEWCDVWDGLYWRFVARHAESLAGNNRTSQLPRAFARLDPARRDRILTAAERFIERTTE
jgi:deoxyribodipyrimidine photolyase-related protein